MVSLGLNANKEGCYYSIFENGKHSQSGFLPGAVLGESKHIEELLTFSDSVTVVASHFNSYRGQPKKISGAANNTAAIGFLCKTLDIDFEVVEDNAMYKLCGCDWASFPEIMNEAYNTPLDAERGLLLAIFASIMGRRDD